MAIDPVRIFELRGQISTVLSVMKSLTVGSNRVIVAGQAGKIIRVMGWSAVGSTATPGYLNMRTETIASTNIALIPYPAVTAGFAEKSPIVNCGYGETLVGDGLSCEVVAGDVFLSCYYIVYKS